MRGGSTIGGELFNRDPRAVLWYEPLAAYYTAYYGIDYITKPSAILYDDDLSPVNFTEEEITRLVNFYKKSFSCDLNQLPAEIWLHKIITHSQTLNIIKKCIKTTDRAGLITNYPTPATVCGSIVTSRQRHCPEILQVARYYTVDHPLEKSTNETFGNLKRFLENRLSSMGLTIKEYRKLINHIMNVERLRSNYQHCMELGIQRCKGKMLNVMETLRLKMSHLETILLHNPDMYVIYYVRDPRGIIASRISGMKPSSNRTTMDIVIDTATVLCKTMKDDLESMHKLEAKYPEVFIDMRYEDLVLSPMETAEEIYRILGVEYPGVSKWQLFVDEVFNSKEEDGRFGVKRSNPSHQIYKWKTQLKPKYLNTINRICKGVIFELGYQI
ncbi:hypothetical protein LSH36_3g20029 [Paralvinella palmiformis]|uniref:Sulfotransferase n=1 Tax=Paralvinella palmiformis TaxID=53620 RepID=A0AAD9KFJ0_9ANNE|nr:hypothetical protein LSH36_3g20029 [Paralvinella palmiformis]